MSFHDILAKPVQIMKEILDLESEFESPSLASQFVAIKHQMEKIQDQLRESNRISHEKDLVIAKLQRAMAAKAQPRPAGPASLCQDSRPVERPPVRELQRAVSAQAREETTGRSRTPEQAQIPPTEVADELKLPAAPSCQAAIQQARSVRPCPAARMTLSPPPDAAEPQPSAPAATRAKAKRARPTRTRVAAKKTAATTATKTTKAAQATKSTTAAKARPTRTRVAAKKTAATTATKTKKTTRAGKSNAAAKAKSTRTRTTTKKATAKPKRSARASNKK